MTMDFPHRFEREIKGHLSSGIQVYAPPTRKYIAWMGGSMSASLSSFDSMAVTKSEYDEWGAAVVHNTYV